MFAEALRDERKRLLIPLAKAAIPLEVLHGTSLDAPWLAAEVKGSIVEAVEAIRSRQAWPWTSTGPN